MPTGANTPLDEDLTLDDLIIEEELFGKPTQGSGGTTNNNIIC